MVIISNKLVDHHSNNIIIANLLYPCRNNPHMGVDFQKPLHTPQLNNDQDKFPACVSILGH